MSSSYSSGSSFESIGDLVNSPCFADTTLAINYDMFIAVVNSVFDYVDVWIVKDFCILNFV